MEITEQALPISRIRVSIPILLGVCLGLLHLFFIWHHRLFMDEWINIEKASLNVKDWWTHLDALSDLFFIFPIHALLDEPDRVQNYFYVLRLTSWFIWWVFVPTVIYINRDAFVGRSLECVVFLLCSGSLAVYSVTARPTVMGFAGVFVLQIARQRKIRAVGWLLAWMYPPALLAASSWMYLQKRKLKILFICIFAVCFNLGVLPLIGFIQQGTSWDPYINTIAMGGARVTYLKWLWFFNPPILVIFILAIVAVFRVTHDSIKLRIIAFIFCGVALQLIAKSFALQPRYFLTFAFAASVWFVLKHGHHHRAIWGLLATAMIFSNAGAIMAPNRTFESTPMESKDLASLRTLVESEINSGKRCTIRLVSSDIFWTFLHLDAFLNEGIWDPLKIGAPSPYSCELEMPATFKQYINIHNRSDAYIKYFAEERRADNLNRVLIIAKPTQLNEFDFLREPALIPRQAN